LGSAFAFSNPHPRVKKTQPQIFEDGCGAEYVPDNNPLETTSLSGEFPPMSKKI